jgi:acyl carrier protein
MEESLLRSRITETFRDVLNSPTLELKDEMTAHEVKGWDSISHIDLIVALEGRFKIRLTTGEVSKLKNVGDLVALIRKKAP